MKTTANIELEYAPEDLEQIVLSQVREIVNAQVQSVTNALIKESIQAIIKEKVQGWVDASLANYRFEAKENNQIVPITIEEQMQRAFVFFMNEKVDEYGRVSYDGKRRIDQILKTQINEVYERTIKPQVTQAAQNMKKELNDKLLQEVTDKFKSLLFKQ